MRQRRRKVRHLTARNRTGLYVQALDDPHKGLTLQGTAQLTRASLSDRCLQIARRYVAAEALQIWHAHMPLQPKYPGAHYTCRLCAEWFKLEFVTHEPAQRARRP